MKKYMLGLCLVCTFTAGCSIEGVPMINQKVDTVNQSVVKADPIIDGLEAAIGRPIVSPKVAATGEKVTSTGQTVLRVGAGIATAAGQPAVGGLLIALSGLMGTFAGIFRKRKKTAEKATEKAEKAVNTLIKAGNDSPGFGKNISEKAKTDGNSDYIETAYKQTV